MKEDLFYLGIKALIRNGEGKILLLRVNPEALSGHKREPYWDIPGGRIERDSSVEETLQREIEEETGITEITNAHPVSMVLSNIRVPREDIDYGLILSVYSCDIDTGRPIKISDEHTEYGWFTPTETARMLEVKYPPEFTETVKAL